MTKISTPDLSDMDPEAKAIELPWINYGKHRQFGGQAVTIKCHEDNSLVKQCVEESGLGRVIVVDGFIAGSAVLVAARLAPAVLTRCVFAHCSAEAGHALMLRTLDATPLLHLGLRLGEGSGAALAWPLLESACRLLNDMASFDAAGVSRQVDLAALRASAP